MTTTMMTMMKIWHANSSVKIHSLSKSCMKTEHFHFTVKSSLYLLAVELRATRVACRL